jgi:hypothetical protein
VAQHEAWMSARRIKIGRQIQIGGAVNSAALELYNLGHKSSSMLMAISQWPAMVHGGWLGSKP